MAQLVQTNGDYTIKTNEGGQIVFDTGPGIGNIKVTGNLIVEGDTLTVSAENLNVNDNVIILNFGETGSGVSLRYSGLQIDRGSSSPASFFYDENDDTFNIANGSPEGIFNFADSALRTRRILTDSDTDSGDLLLIGTGAGVVKVSGTINYEQQITDDDDIPNKKYVDDSIRDNPTFQIIDNDTRVIVTDTDVPGSLAYLIDNTSYSSFGESAVSVIVDGTLTSQFFASRAVLQGLEIQNNEITNNDTNSNVFIRTQGTGRLQTNYAVELENISLDPAFVSNSNTVYSKTPQTGDTGIYFNNSTSNGELISKNRALLFGMLF